ncbi:MAG: fused MFS/spermidine synthase [Kiritimatiellia bacterium]
MRIFILVFFSGFAGLVYQVLWMKQLGLLFGSTAHAAAATLACLFAGFSLGSWFWGRRAAQSPNALRLYAALQLGIALTAVFYFGILQGYYQIYPFLYQHIHSRPLLLIVKFLLTLLLIFPPAFCMGGTLPAIGQYLISKRSRFGVTATRVYGVNTLGAALGAYMAGFHLPLWLGFRLTFLSSMIISAGVSILAFQIARHTHATHSDQPLPPPDEPRATTLTQVPASARSGRWAILPLCFLSGFGFLALEVLWTRMFGQVLENSVYTYSTILVIVLICLSAGALISSFLSRTRISPYLMLTALTLLSGTAIALTPFVLMRLTNNLQVIAFRGTWPSYIRLIFRYGFLTFGPPALLAGTVFPLLMKAEERYAEFPGKSLGRMAAVDTAGSILGALLCGFVFLEWLGMWRTMQGIAVLYLAASFVLPFAWNKRGIPIKCASVLAIILVGTTLNPTHLPITSIDPLRGPEEVLQIWEGRDCTVAVTRDRHGLAIKINSHYGLGSTGSYMQSRMQNDIPLFAYPQTESIFFLGMGTGITAGAALHPQFHNTQHIVTAELVPEVIDAARTYFTRHEGVDYTGGLFEDPRARILAEDGRHFLMASGERFDMINSDLFVPFRVGDGNLYSKEHFESSKHSLTPGGVFVQWLPLYMMTEYEFFVIARTMLEVFDQVSLWRGTFQPLEEIVALVGHTPPYALPASGLDESAARLAAVAGKSHHDVQRLSLPLDPQSILFFYAGNVTASRERFEAYPVNRDDHPLIEYMAPRNYRQETDGPTPWFVGPRILRLIEELQQRCPPDQDPLLAHRSAQARRLPLAGTAFHRARIWEVVEHEPGLREDWQRFVSLWTSANVDESPQTEE